MNFMSERNLNDCALELPLQILSIPFFPSYLTGLLEGDGTIIVPTTSAKDKLNYPSIQIVFPSKDFPLVTRLCEITGHGSIHKKKKSPLYIYTVNSSEGILYFINIINGYLRGPKYIQFVKLVNYLNNQNQSIILKPLDTSCLGSNSWLTGFIEAAGSFQVRASSIKNPTVRLGLSCEITQARLTADGFSTLNLMNSISNFLGVNLEHTRGDRKYPEYRVRTSSVLKNIQIRDYLMEYPLKSSKYLDFKDWCLVLNYFENKTHKENMGNITKIKSQMNQSRKEFNWNHIIKFN